jgi:hypothetical protein
VTQYERQLDNLIITELRNLELKHKTSTCTELCESFNLRKIKVRRPTVSEHLARLCKYGIIIKKSSASKKYNRKNYFLSPATLFQLRYNVFDFEAVETQRGDPIRREETQQTKNRKILTLLLLQAASRSSRWKVAQEFKPGLVGWLNPKTRKCEWLETYNETGVTTMDVIQSRDHSNVGLFSHISFNEADVEDCYNKLIFEYEGLSDIIRKNVRQNGEREFYVQHSNMRSLILSCVSILSNDRIETTLKLAILKSSKEAILPEAYSKSKLESRRSVRRSKFIRDSLEWYLASFGQIRFNTLYAQTMVTKIKCKLNNENIYRQIEQKAFHDQREYGLSYEEMYNRLYAMMLEELETIIATESIKMRRIRGKEEKRLLNRAIKRLEKYTMEQDKFLLYNYHCRVIYDKRDKWESERNCNFLENIPDEYHDGHLFVRNMLLDIVYPEFLRKEHRNNPELAKFVCSLPDNKK